MGYLKGTAQRWQQLLTCVLKFAFKPDSHANARPSENRGQDILVHSDQLGLGFRLRRSDHISTHSREKYKVRGFGAGLFARFDFSTRGDVPDRRITNEKAAGANNT